MKDLFSKGSTQYAKFRPRYPDALFNYLASQCRQRNAVWDCATGNGQAAVPLGKRFDRVYATDLSEAQLKSAEQHHNVVYAVGTAEKSGLPARSVNLITVAQAYHWFDHPKFFQEALRVGQPGAMVAVWCYGLAQITPEIDAAVDLLYTGVLEKYWEPERRFVENGYKTLPFEFREIRVPSFQMEADWTLDQLLGYFSTWSALKKYDNERGGDALAEHRAPIEKAWGTRETRSIVWPLSVRAGFCPN